MSVFEALQDEHLLKGTTEETKVDETEKPAEVVTPAPVVTPEKVEEVVTPTEVVKEKVAEVVTPAKTLEETPEEAKEEKVPEKLKIDYLEFINKNKSVIDAYHTEKSIDYSQLSPEDVLRKEMKIKYPSLTSEDINEELRLKYGLGVDTSDYDSEELIAHKAKQRKLKIDSTDAISALETYRDSLTLPEFEVDVPTKEIVKAPEDLEDIINKRIEATTQEGLAWREDVWVPQIKETVGAVASLTEEVEVEGVGTIKVEVELDEADKNAISEYLSSWTGHPTDSAFLPEGQDPDLKGFVQHKAAEILRKKVLAKVGQAAVAQYKEKFIKEEVVNFNQETTTTPLNNYESNAVFDIADKMRAK